MSVRSNKSNVYLTGTEVLIKLIIRYINLKLDLPAVYDHDLHLVFQPRSVLARSFVVLAIHL